MKTPLTREFGNFTLYAERLCSFPGTSLERGLPDRERRLIAYLIRDLLSWTGCAWVATVPDETVLHNSPAEGAVVCPIEGPEGITALLVVGPNHERLPYSFADRRLIQDFSWEIGAILRRSESYK